MQSYQLHIVPEHLRKRHPYLEPPFKARYDPTEVNKAVFDRTIPKLIEILLTENLAGDKYTNALITLNELASDQTEKYGMIEQGCVGLASAFLHCKLVSIRREATLLLGLLLSTVEGLTKMCKQTYSGLSALLFDEELEVRNAVCWAICRISLSRQGAEIICREAITKSIVESFLKYSERQAKEEEYFIVYLLESFKHLLAYDSGIQFCIKSGLTARLKQLSKTAIYSQDKNLLIHHLSLNVLCNIAMNPVGKEECVSEEVIRETEHFLESTINEQIANEVSLIMFTSIHLLGKKQCIYNKEGKVDTAILVKLIKLLERDNVQEIVKNDVRQTLKIIAEEMDGFLAIADYMSKHVDIKYVDEIFSTQIIVPLALLLPKVKEVADPPTLPSNKITDYKAYVKTINHMLARYEGAVEIAIKQCVDITPKLIMFMCYRGDKILQEGVVESLSRLIKHHPYSAKIAKDFIAEYGETEHKISKTTVKNELKRFDNLVKALDLKL